MSDAADTLDIALALIRGDLERIRDTVADASRTLKPQESGAVARYVSALCEAQKADLAVQAAAEKEMNKLPPSELFKQLRDMPGMRDFLDRDERPALNGHGKRKRRDAAEED